MKYKLIFLVILFLPFISAIDDKVVIDKCEFALSSLDVSSWAYEGTGGTDENLVFKPWNDASQEGIFMIAENKNPIVGQAPDYEVTRYTAERVWFNEFEVGKASDTSKVPIIKVGASTVRIPYIRCSYVVGDYRIFLDYSSGHGELTYFTNDFNLTKNIISPTDVKKISILTPEKYNASYSGSNIMRDIADYKLNNKISLGEDGLFPNTKPYIIYKGDRLNDKPTSLESFTLWWLLRDSARVSLVTSPFYYAEHPMYYINNTDTTRKVENFLTVVPYIFSRCTLPACSDKAIGYDNYAVELLKGKNYQMNVTLRNVYKVPVSINFEYYVRNSIWPTTRGLGMADVPMFEKEPTKTLTVTIPATSDYVLKNVYYHENDDNLSVALFEALYYENANDPIGMKTTQFFPALASEKYPYLSFMSLDPRVEMTKSAGKYTPVFNIRQELYGENYTNNQNIDESDYSLVGRIYKENFLPSNIVFSENIDLTEDLNKGQVKTINWVVPIDYSWDFSNRYYVKFLSKMEKAITPNTDFQGKFLAMSPGSPYFKPGDIIYPTSSKLVFSSNGRKDIEKIVLFNPSFYNTQIELNVISWSDNQNFSLSWDGINYGKLPKYTVNLLPLESKELVFAVNATYVKWPTNPLLESLIIKANTSVRVGDEYENKENSLTYDLEVRNTAVNWFDFVLDGYEPDVMQAEEGKEKTVKYSWREMGDQLGFGEKAGDSYKVSLKLLKKSTGAILKEVSGTYTVGSLEGWKNIQLTYPFVADQYQLYIDVDYANEVGEIDSSGEEADDNALIVDYPVVSCKIESNLLYYYDYLQGWILDENCNSGCSCYTDTQCTNGGYCSSLVGECDFDKIDKCNDISLHEDEMCAWTCSVEAGNYGCPPPSDYSESGLCNNCGSIINSCGGYNNEMTCELDPCNKASYDCDFLDCDASKSYSCIWDSDSQYCLLNSTVNGVFCSYKLVMGECNSNKVATAKYIETTGNVGCPAKPDREIKCGSELIKLDFFSIYQLIISIIVLTLVYLRKIV